MNTCGTCRFLGKELTHFDEKFNVIAPIYHVCDWIAFESHARYGMNASGKIAGVIDGSGYYAALCVRDDFGCNQWKAKDETSTASP